MQICDHDMAMRQASFKEVFNLAWPMILSMASMSILGLVDTYFMGWIGPEAQAAVGFGAPSTFSILSLFFGLISGLSTFVGQYYGAKQFKECAKMLWHVLGLGAFFGILCALFMNPLIWQLLVVMHVNPDFIDPTYEYMQWRMWASPWVFVSYGLISFLRGKGDMMTPLIVSILTVLINIPLTYVFAFGFGPIPAFGVAGAAIGTVISQFVEMVCFGIVTFNRSNHELFATRCIPRFSLEVYKKFMPLALPVGIAWAVEQWGWIVYGLYVSSLSKAEAAANAIIQVFMNLAFMPGLAISIATTTLVGQYLGAKNPRAAEKSANYAIIMSIAALMSLGVIMFCLRHTIANGFSTDSEVIRISINLFYFAFIYQVFDAAGITTSGALRGAGDTRFPMVVSVACLWGIMVPGIFIQDKVWHWGVYGAWGVASAAIMVMGTLYFIRFKRGKWKSMGVV